MHLSRCGVRPLSFGLVAGLLLACLFFVQRDEFEAGAVRERGSRVPNEGLGSERQRGGGGGGAREVVSTSPPPLCFLLSPRCDATQHTAGTS